MCTESTDGEPLEMGGKCWKRGGTQIEGKRKWKEQHNPLLNDSFSSRVGPSHPLPDLKPPPRILTGGSTCSGWDGKLLPTSTLLTDPTNQPSCEFKLLPGETWAAANYKTARDQQNPILKTTKPPSLSCLPFSGWWKAATDMLGEPYLMRLP